MAVYSCPGCALPCPGGLLGTRSIAYSQKKARGGSYQKLEMAIGPYSPLSYQALSRRFAIHSRRFH